MFMFSVLLPPSLVWLASAVFPACLPFPHSSGYWNTECMARVMAINCVSQPSLALSPEPTPPPLPCSWTANHTLANMHLDILWVITAFKIVVLMDCFVFHYKLCSTRPFECRSNITSLTSLTIVCRKCKDSKLLGRPEKVIKDSYFSKLKKDKKFIRNWETFLSDRDLMNSTSYKIWPNTDI